WGILPRTFFASLGFKPAAFTAIRSEPGPGIGRRTSWICNSSKEPVLSKRSAFIQVPVRESRSPSGSAAASRLGSANSDAARDLLTNARKAVLQVVGLGVLRPPQPQQLARRVAGGAYLAYHGGAAQMLLNGES